MNESFFASLESLETVWRRVTAGADIACQASPGKSERPPSNEPRAACSAAFPEGMVPPRPSPLPEATQDRAGRAPSASLSGSEANIAASPLSAAVLRSLIAGAAEREAGLSLLARRIKSMERRLTRLSAQQLQRRLMLETELFLLTGEVIHAPPSGHGCGGAPPRLRSRGALTELRLICLSAYASADALLGAADRSENESLSAMCRRLADGDRELAEEARRIIASML